MNIQKKAIHLTDLAIGIIILGIVVGIGSTILITMRDSRLTELGSVQTINESFTPTTAGTQLAETWATGVSNIVNNSGTWISSGNYTVTIDSTFGFVTVANTTGNYTSDWNATYSWYNTSRTDWSLPNNASIGLAEYGNWFKIIVIVGVAAVVLSLIFMAFGGRRGGGGTTY